MRPSKPRGTPAGRTAFKPLLALATLCATAGAGARAEAPPEPRPLGRELSTYEAPASVDAPAVPALGEDPTGELSLAGALRLAVAHSPTLASFSWEQRARDAELLQARALPNPELATEVEDFAGSGERRGFRSSQTTLAFA
jgi:hypothetical protein